MSDETETRLKELEDEVKKISTQLTRYKGFVGGVIFTVSCLATAVSLAWSHFKS